MRFSLGAVRAVVGVVVTVALWPGTVAQAQVETLYGGTGGTVTVSDLLVLDPASGAVLDSVGSTGFGLTGLAVSPVDGLLYGVTTGGDDRFLVQIDRGAGAATAIGGPLGAVVADITFTPDGTLYGWSESTDDLVTIDVTTGVATVVGESGVGTFGSGLAYDAANDRLLFAGGGSDGDFYTVDRQTGAATVLSTLNGPVETAVSALAFDCDGTLYGVVLAFDEVRSTQLATIDPDTGAVTVLGDSEDRLDAIAFDCAEPPAPPPPGPTPEPVVIEPTFTG
jgi:DNA-binding beta-propeller fold protein YncE